MAPMGSTFLVTPRRRSRSLYRRMGGEGTESLVTSNDENDRSREDNVGSGSAPAAAAAASEKKGGSMRRLRTPSPFRGRSPARPQTSSKATTSTSTRSSSKKSSRAPRRFSWREGSMHDSDSVGAPTTEARTGSSTDRATGSRLSSSPMRPPLATAASTTQDETVSTATTAAATGSTMDRGLRPPSDTGLPPTGSTATAATTENNGTLQEEEEGVMEVLRRDLQASSLFQNQTADEALYREMARSVMRWKERARRQPSSSPTASEDNGMYSYMVESYDDTDHPKNPNHHRSGSSSSSCQDINETTDRIQQLRIERNNNKSKPSSAPVQSHDEDEASHHKLEEVSGKLNDLGFNDPEEQTHTPSSVKVKSQGNKPKRTPTPIQTEFSSQDSSDEVQIPQTTTEDEQNLLWETLKLQISDEDPPKEPETTEQPQTTQTSTQSSSSSHNSETDDVVEEDACSDTDTSFGSPPTSPAGFFTPDFHTGMKGGPNDESISQQDTDTDTDDLANTLASTSINDNASDDDDVEEEESEFVFSSVTKTAPFEATQTPKAFATTEDIEKEEHTQTNVKTGPGKLRRKGDQEDKGTANDAAAKTFGVDKNATKSTAILADLDLFSSSGFPGVSPDPSTGQPFFQVDLSKDKKKGARRTGAKGKRVTPRGSVTIKGVPAPTTTSANLGVATDANGFSVPYPQAPLNVPTSTGTQSSAENNDFEMMWDSSSFSTVDPSTTGVPPPTSSFDSTHDRREPSLSPMNVSITSPTASEPEPSAEPTADEIIANAAARAAAKAAESTGLNITAVFSLGAHNPRGAKSMSSPRANGAAGNNPRRRSNRNASIRNLNLQKTIESTIMSAPPPPPPPPPQSEANATDFQTPAQTISGSSGASEEIDYSGKKARVNSLRDEGRSNYISGNYSESITHFTRAIQTQYQGIHTKTLEESKDHILAVLHGNRAAALMMVGAFDAAAYDCDQALQYVPMPKAGGPLILNSESGPALQCKLMCRKGRALLKGGKVIDAERAFQTALVKAKRALSQSIRGELATRKLSEAHKQAENVLNQAVTDATLAQSEIKRFNDATDGMLNCTHGHTYGSSSATRRNNLQVLMHVNTALSTSPGAMGLHEKKIALLATMKRWTELSANCERLAVALTKLDNIFEGDLANINPFPGVPTAKFLKSDFFDDKPSSNGTLSANAIGEAVLRLPPGILPHYLRSLRLEERYVEGNKAAKALGILAADPTILRIRRLNLSWLTGEKDKLRRTMTGKDMGDSLFRNGDYERSATKYASCLTIDGEGEPVSATTDDEYATAGGRLHAVLHCNRAACFMALQRYVDAIKDCTAALRIFPHYMKAILRRARCYARLNRHEEAISEYTRWLQLVEEAKKSPRTSSSSISSCPFDKASDVSADDTKKSRAELAEVKKSKADAARTSQAEASFRASQQKWQRDKFSSSGTSTTSTNAHSRRDQYYNQQGGSGSRRWDSFNGTSPKKPGRTRTKASSSSSNTGQQSSSSQPVESDDNASATHYSVLELPRSATQADIKKAFRKMALKYHPDKNPDASASDKFRQAKMAYEVLNEEETRRAYDFETRLEGRGRYNI